MPAPIIMWRARYILNSIERVECSKITEKLVFIVAEPNHWSGGIKKHTKPCRCSIVNANYSYHKTWAEAHAALLAHVDFRLNQCRHFLDKLQGDYNNVKGMKPPADAEVQP